MFGSMRKLTTSGRYSAGLLRSIAKPCLPMTCFQNMMQHLATPNRHLSASLSSFWSRATGPRRLLGSLEPIRSLAFDDDSIESECARLCVQV
eukprot:99178-Alexandrium_andersonii.AAC.1